MDIRAAEISAILKEQIKNFGQEAEVTVAEQLNDARMNDIRDALKQVTGKDVQVDLKVDPTIIGGLVVKLGSRMIDSSLRTKLNAIKHAMKEVP